MNYTQKQTYASTHVYFSSHCVHLKNIFIRDGMEHSLLVNLPKEGVQTMENYIKDGKYVNYFKVNGNSHGFSVTIHFCNAKNDLDPLWSPGISNTCAYKSPSNRRRDE